MCENACVCDVCEREMEREREREREREGISLQKFPQNNLSEKTFYRHFFLLTTFPLTTSFLLWDKFNCDLREIKSFPVR